MDFERAGVDGSLLCYTRLNRSRCVTSEWWSIALPYQGLQLLVEWTSNAVIALNIASKLCWCLFHDPSTSEVLHHRRFTQALDQRGLKYTIHLCMDLIFS
jgi:hypothetical protein